MKRLIALVVCVFLMGMHTMLNADGTINKMIHHVSTPYVSETKTVETASDDTNVETTNVGSGIEVPNTEDAYTLVDAEPCDTSGDRKPNAKVDIGYDSNFANREYWAYTNNIGQLIYVQADEIIAQSDRDENSGSDRYCSDEAKVPGVEASDLDEGHVIADSLGGVSNAYNITPEDSYTNRNGNQAEFEEEIRNALYDGSSVTDFEAVINYDDASMTPSDYKISYYIDNELVTHTFENAS